MVPLLLYLPPLFAGHSFTMQEISGMTLIQVLFSAVFGLPQHWRAGNVAPRLIWLLGSGMVAGSFAGAIASKHTSQAVLLAVFAGLTLAGAIMMLVRRDGVEPAANSGLQFSTWRAAAAAAMAFLVGGFSGMVGTGGAFLLIPLMVQVLGVPMRTAIGTSLAAVFFSALSGAAGKIVTGQVAWAPTAVLVLTSLVGAPLGAKLSQRTRVQSLKWVLAAIMAGISLQVTLRLLP